MQGARRKLAWHPKATAWVVGVLESKDEVAGWQGNVIDEVGREPGRAPYWVGSGQGMGDDD